MGMTLSARATVSGSAVNRRTRGTRAAKMPAPAPDAMSSVTHAATRNTSAAPRALPAPSALATRVAVALPMAEASM